MEDTGYDDLLRIARIFAKSDLPKMEMDFIDSQVNDVATTPLSANRCIKVTIEYSDIQEKESLEELCSQITDENKPELLV